MKRALLVGIQEYDHFSGLSGCVNDVQALTPLLARHTDGQPNFDCRAYTSDTYRMDRRTIVDAMDALLSPGADVALLYFAGHGAAAENDVVLVTQDGINNDPGIALSTVLGRVQKTPIREVIIILDCCFSGGAGSVPQLGPDIAALRPGVALLSASRSDQPAAETGDGRGLFSVYLCGAL